MMATLFVTLALVLTSSVNAVHWQPAGSFATNGHEGKITDKTSNFVYISEATPVGMVIASLRPFGVSSTKSKKLMSYIDWKSDPKRQFSISQGDLVVVAKPLDRKDIEEYNLSIKSIDKAGNVESQAITVRLRASSDIAQGIDIIDEAANRNRRIKRQVGSSTSTTSTTQTTPTTTTRTTQTTTRATTPTTTRATTTTTTRATTPTTTIATATTTTRAPTTPTTRAITTTTTRATTSTPRTTPYHKAALSVNKSTMTITLVFCCTIFLMASHFFS